MNIRLNENIHATNAVQLNLFIFVMSPIAHAGHICPASVVLFISLCEDNVPIEGDGKSAAPVGLDPAVVVEAAFDIAAVFITMEPDVCSCLLVF